MSEGVRERVTRGAELPHVTVLKFFIDFNFNISKFKCLISSTCTVNVCLF